MEFDAYVFDKLDGSNLRFEWSRKNGWYKYGTRNRLFDNTDPAFGPAIEIFNARLAGSLHDIVLSQRVTKAIVFCEYLGKNSFAGLHQPGDEMDLYPFDVALFNQGILGPKEFLKLFGHLNIPKFLGLLKWGPKLLSEVKNGTLDGVTFEGVVGKAKTSKHDLILAKAKSQAWLDKVKSTMPEDMANELINS